MGHLHSVLLGDAGWITALLVGIIIESLLSRPARRRRIGTFGTSAPNWLSAAGGTSSVVKSKISVSGDYEANKK
jgi:hypothetical protein